MVGLKKIDRPFVWNDCLNYVYKNEVIVGDVDPYRVTGGWHAWGCLNGFRDVDLGRCNTRERAMERVEKWVEKEIS